MVQRSHGNSIRMATGFEEAIKAAGLNISPEDIPRDGTGRLNDISIPIRSRQHLIRSRAGVTKLDTWLSPFSETLKRRYAKAQEWKGKIEQDEGGVDNFSQVREHSICSVWQF